jgi:6-phospho-3-hexuloisomerase
MMKKIINTVTNEMVTVLGQVQEEEAIDLSKELRNAKRVFVCGEGRSGLMGKAFAMRLMHGGYQVYVVGETITPSIQKDDLLIAISGSGSTGAIIQLSTKAVEVGARVFLVTTNKNSKLANVSHRILVIPAATKYRLPEEPNTIQPLGNQFDQAVHLLLDAVIISNLQEEDRESANTNMSKRHSNLE